MAIEGCDSQVGNMLFDDGSTMNDLIGRCGGRASNHDHFVSCVAGLATGWEMAGFISGVEHGRVQRCAARSSIP